MTTTATTAASTTAVVVKEELSLPLLLLAVVVVVWWWWCMGDRQCCTMVPSQASAYRTGRETEKHQFGRFIHNYKTVCHAWLALRRAFVRSLFNQYTQWQVNKRGDQCFIGIQRRPWVFTCEWVDNCIMLSCLASTGRIRKLTLT